jgi:hypothetical protein
VCKSRGSISANTLLFSELYSGGKSPRNPPGIYIINL